jgi:hypothetical protein
MDGGILLTVLCTLEQVEGHQNYCTACGQISQYTRVSLAKRPNHSTAHPHPTKILSIFQSCQKILRTSQDMKNDIIISNIGLFFQNCGVKVSKNKVERLSDVYGKL